MADEQEVIRRFLESLPDKPNILEQGIDLETQKEYLDRSRRFDRGSLTEEQTLDLAGMLFNPEFPIAGKKKALGLLAHSGTILAFRQIEKYCGNPDTALKQWSTLALQECKMFLESEIMDESSGFIVSGLGGVRDKLRFYFLILSATGRPFTNSEKDIIEKEIALTSEQLNSIVDTFYFSDTFVGTTVLIPMDIAVATFIETAIKNCNETGSIVFEHYYVTNQNIPDKAEIREIVKMIKEG